MPSREELWEVLKRSGAETRDTMTKRANLLLIGEGYGQTKINAALKWSCPTISLPMAEYLGLLDPQGNSLLVDPQLKGLLPELLVTHAFLCELLYGQFVRLSGQSDPRATAVLGAFYQLSAGLAELLRIAWGDTDGGSADTSEGLDDLLRSLEVVRAEAEEPLRAGG